MVPEPAFIEQAKRPAIAIRNLYYMFLYAWELFSEGTANQVSAIEASTLQNLLARVLASGVRRLLRRGMDCAYREFVEETASPRGSFLLSETMRPGPRSRGRAVCSFDELCSDVPHNRAIKATLRALEKTRNLDSALRLEMGALALRMREVRDVPLSAALFRGVQLGRNNRHYRLLIKICELVFESLIPGEGEEESRFASLLDDEIRMSELFEKFVRNFYIAEQYVLKVRAEQVDWHATFDDPRDEAYLPQMRTDLTMRTAGRTIVMDTKYYREILSRRMGGLAKLRSGHLYQLMTYLRQVRCDESVPHVAEGLLLYVRAGDLDLDVAYAIGGFKIRARTLDLNADWSTIHKELLSLVA
jgi:5-methylcytosine-specific restriction enzyme subunit McrC